LNQSAVFRIVDPVLAVVFPSRCPECQSFVEHPTRGPLCGDCWAALPRHRGELCPCGVPLAGASSAVCGRCRRGLSLFRSGFSLGPYEGGLRAVIHELKFHGRRRVADRLAERMAASPAAAAVLTSGAVLVPVPLHPRRRRQRGFNQSELLARALARRCPLVTVAADAVVRRKETPPQTGLSAAARRSNVAGAFAVRRRCRVDGRVVVVVDDVVTTGATARACAAALREAGAAEVRLLSAARVD